jgi:hypothetical protein
MVVRNERGNKPVVRASTVRGRTGHLVPSTQYGVRSLTMAAQRNGY